MPSSPIVSHCGSNSSNKDFKQGRSGSQSIGTMLSLSTFRNLPWNAPFYAKLGFRILDASELTGGFQAIREHEHQAGLPIVDRVIMYCALWEKA
jgi:hypothetical protein